MSLVLIQVRLPWWPTSSCTTGEDHDLFRPRLGGADRNNDGLGCRRAGPAIAHRDHAGAEVRGCVEVSGYNARPGFRRPGAVSLQIQLRRLFVCDEFWNVGQ